MENYNSYNVEIHAGSTTLESSWTIPGRAEDTQPGIQPLHAWAATLGDCACILGIGKVLTTAWATLEKTWKR